MLIELPPRAAFRVRAEMQGLFFFYYYFLKIVIRDLHHGDVVDIEVC